MRLRALVHLRKLVEKNSPTIHFGAKAAKKKRLGYKKKKKKKKQAMDVDIMDADNPATEEQQSADSDFTNPVHDENEDSDEDEAPEGGVAKLSNLLRGKTKASADADGTDGGDRSPSPSFEVEVPPRSRASSAVEPPPIAPDGSNAAKLEGFLADTET